MASSARWISAMRLRTLPLAVSCIGLGAALAARAGSTRWDLAWLAILTTVAIQIVSNLANDYGDAIHGADHAGRAGPTRGVSSGAISRASMRRAISIAIGVSLSLGIFLLYSAQLSGQEFVILFILGLLCIAAALGYTLGKRPYGYVGLGDLSVFIFFGWVGISAVYYLMMREWQYDLLWPASSISLLAVGVLNLNNIRDIDSDRLAGKYSIPVRIGRSAAFRYQDLLMAGSMLCAAIYLMMHPALYAWAYLLLSGPLLWISIQLRSAEDAQQIDRLLPILAMSTLIFSIVYGSGLLISP